MTQTYTKPFGRSGEYISDEKREIQKLPRDVGQWNESCSNDRPLRCGLTRDEALRQLLHTRATLRPSSLRSFVCTTSFDSNAGVCARGAAIGDKLRGRVVGAGTSVRACAPCACTKLFSPLVVGVQ